MRLDTIKLLEEKHRTLYDINVSNIFFYPSSRILEIKKKWTNKTCLNSKTFAQQGKSKQNEKTMYRLGENICKWCDWEGTSLQNLQTAHET